MHPRRVRDEALSEPGNQSGLLRGSVLPSTSWPRSRFSFRSDAAISCTTWAASSSLMASSRTLSALAAAAWRAATIVFRASAASSMRGGTSVAILRIPLVRPVKQPYV
jgi:hypothetical protein